MQDKRFGISVGLILVVGAILIAALPIAARLHPHSWSAREFAELSDGGIRSDGWIQRDAAVSLDGFFSRGNYVEFVFNPWRPAGDAAQLQVSVCGGQSETLTISSRDPVRVSLRGQCATDPISFKAVNPFLPSSEREGQPLVVQLERVSVSSRLGFPIPSASKVGMVAALLLPPVVCAAYGFGGISLLGLLAAVLTLVGAVVISLCSDAEPQKFFPLWVFVTSVFAGVAVWRVGNVEGEGNDTDLKVPRHKALAFVVAVLPLTIGAGLRFYGISFGLPWNFHPDEVPKVNALMRMYDQQTWNPQYFLHPSLLLYSTYFMNVVLQALGVDGSFRETAFLAGRLVSASAGVASIGLTWLIGKQLFSSRVGWWGAMFLAVFPLHVTCSRYLKEDALLTFVALSSVACAVLAVRMDKKWLLLLSGLLAGATAGTKYSGILMIAVPLSAPWLASRSFIPDVRWIPWALGACLLAPAGFLATTPYALLDSEKFLKDFGAESRHMQTGHTTSIDAWSQLWMYHFWRSLKPGMTTLAAVASVVGAGFLLRRRKIEDLFLLGLIALFYLPAEYVKAKPAPQPERYVTPCLPFLALALAELFRVMATRIQLNHRGLAILCTALLAFPCIRTVTLASEVPNDTRLQMSEWIEQNVPAGSTILMDWKPYCPRFEDGRYNIVYIPRARIIPELDVKALKASGGQYLVLSSLFYSRYFLQPEAEPVLRQRIREVFERVPVVKQFAPKAGTYGFHNPVLTLFSLDQQHFAKLDEELALKRKGSLELTSNEARASVRW